MECSRSSHDRLNVAQLKQAQELQALRVAVGKKKAAAIEQSFRKSSVGEYDAVALGPAPAQNTVHRK